jgi:hypothetical protein
MKVSEGERIPGAEDYWLSPTEKTWLADAYLEYIEKAYENMWVSDLFEQVQVDEKFEHLKPSKFAYNASMSEGLEKSVESIIDAMSEDAHSELSYSVDKKYWGDGDERPLDYYSMVDEFCDETQYNDADFAIFDKGVVLVYGEPIGKEKIKTGFSVEQYYDQVRDEDIVQCYTHRKYEIDESAVRIYVDRKHGNFHRKI